MSIFIPLFVAFGFCAIACFGLARFAYALGLLDRPTARKQHTGDIPLIGGLAIFLTFVALEWYFSAGDIWLSAALGLLVGLGMVDDKFDLPALIKLGGQILAGLIVCFGSGVMITSLGTLPGGNELLLGPLTLPFTIIAIVGLINAFNMIDGIDGLAAGLALMALFHLALAMQLIGKPLDAAALSQIIIICGALGGFLIFNLGFIPQRKVFLGDAGSMMLGLFIAYHLIDASQRQPLTDTLPTSLVPWMVAVPVIDTLRLIFTRLMQGRSPLSPDRTHLHHILQDKGLSPRLTLITILVMADALFWGGFALGRLHGLFVGIAFVLTLIFYINLVRRR